MGREARVIAEIGEWLGEGRLHLDTDELVFRGARRLAMPLSEISAEESGGWLNVRHGDVEARFDLGDYAAKWLHAIRNPRTLLDKLDIRADRRIAMIGVPEPFAAEVAARVGASSGGGAIRTVAGEDGTCDLVLFVADDPVALQRIGELRAAIRNSGAIWVIHPKGRADLSHDAIMAHARPLGLIDVKSARFSDTHAALKLMLPRAAR